MPYLYLNWRRESFGDLLQAVRVTLEERRSAAEP